MFLSRLTICTILLLLLHCLLFIGLIFRILTRNARHLSNLMGPALVWVPVSDSVWTCWNILPRSYVPFLLLVVTLLRILFCVPSTLKVRIVLVVLTDRLITTCLMAKGLRAPVHSVIWLLTLLLGSLP